MDRNFARKKSFRELDIPPRKLLSRRLASLSSEPSMEMFFHQQNDSPQVLQEENLFYKFLPNSSLDDDSDPYASDHFRIYEFKIRKCTRSRSHDWTDCPFAHPGEKARRRCLRRFNYSGTICPDFRRGSCVRGDTCEFAHGVFECWLHPTRYRTEACKDGKNCQRKICFFAHTQSQLRSLDPVVSPGHPGYYRCYPGKTNTISPTSILDISKQSPPPSPQLQLGNGVSPVSRFSKNELMNSQEIMELMQSIKGMNVNSVEQTSKFCNNDQQRSLFAFSPSTPAVSGFSGSARGFKGECSSSMNNLNEGRSGSGSGFKGECSSSANNLNEDILVNESSTSVPGFDFDWVDDLIT